ncbi:MAG TPA: hypothetical protein PLP23_14685 [Panacibacter sp.]|nr:hypothetical protein [Panacibacter sp.]
MNELAGFDFALEISHAVILKFIKRDFRFLAVHAAPPFQIVYPIAGNLARVYMIVEDINFDFQDGNMIMLKLKFDRTSISFTDGTTPVFPLDGSILISNINIRLIDTAATKKSVIVNYDSVNEDDIRIDFSEDSENILKEKYGDHINEFRDLLKNEIARETRNLPNISFPIEFTVIPGHNGSFSPLQFEVLGLKCITNGDKTKQGACIMGNFSVANHGNGNLSQKTEIAITNGKDIRISLSSQAYHSEIFCKSLREVLGAGNVSDLPSSCGNAATIDFRGVTLTEIKDSFKDSLIEINGKYSKLDNTVTCLWGAPGYTISGSFRKTISLSIQNSLISSQEIEFVETDINVHNNCFPDDPLSLWAAKTFVDPFVTDVLGKTIDRLVPSQQSPNTSNAVLPNLVTGTVLNEIIISPEVLSIQGRVSVFPGPLMQKSLELFGSVNSQPYVQTVQGTFVPADTSCRNMKPEYVTTESKVVQYAEYSIRYKMLCPPVTLSWSIIFVNGDGDLEAIDIPDGYRTHNFTINTFFPAPLPSGHFIIRPVQVISIVVGNTITFINRPEDGVYSFRLAVTAVDCTNENANAYADIYFTGDVIEIEPAYKRDLMTCMANHFHDLANYAASHSKYIWHERFSLDMIIPIDHPNPGDLLKSFQRIAAIGTPEALKLLGNIKVAHELSTYSTILYSESQNRTQRLNIKPEI